MQDYIQKLNQYKIPHISVTMSYDTSTNKKCCIHPYGWEKLTFEKSIYNPIKNALIQLTGKNSNIIAVDIDGLEHIVNQDLVKLCKKTCTFYNKTRKGYHFIYKYNDSFPNCRSFKYINDPSNSGFDIKSSGGCIYYGSYYINNNLIKYENIIADDIVEMPLELITEIHKILGTTKTKSKKYINNPITDRTSDFPLTTLVTITTLDKLLQCFKLSHFNNYNEWFMMCFYIKHLNNTNQALDLFIKYSKKVLSYSNTPLYEYQKKWLSIKYTPSFDVSGFFYIARRENTHFFNKIHFEWIDIPKSLFNSIKINSQYLQYHDLLSYHLDNKILAIKSPYGSGKTQFLSKLIDNHYQDKKVLFITNRITLSYALYKDFKNFAHYLDKTISDLNKCDKLIIQLDSLYKIDPNTSLTEFINDDQPTFDHIKQFIAFDEININNYDLIALDECESLLYHLSYSKLNSHHIFNILLTLCKNANKIIALDGDFSDRSYYFLNQINNQQKPIVIENEYKGTSKHFIFSNNQDKFEEEIDTMLKQDQNIVIICMTVKQSEYYYKKYKDHYSTIIHNSIQNDKESLKNINEYWINARLLIYTSTIESGCDFNQEWFHKCFIVLSDMATTPRALMQMISRIRKYKNPNITVFNNCVQFYEFQFPYTFTEIKNGMYKSLCNSDGHLGLLDTILCYNHLETINKNYFITILTKLIREKGYTYEYIKDTKPKIINISNTIYEDIANSKPIVDNDEYTQIMDIIKENNVTDKELREYYFMISKYFMRQVWNFDDDEIDTNTVKKYLPKIQTLFNYKKFIRFNSKNISTYKNDFIMKINYVRDILTKFNIHHQDDFNMSIEYGLSIEGRKRLKYENKNKLTQEQFQEVIKSLQPTLVNNSFRQTFELKKISNGINMTDRECLECIKKVINTFGFVLIVSHDTKRTKNNDTLKKIQYNEYFINLDTCIIDTFNKQLFEYIDNFVEIIVYDE
jgi:hypothetical protein